MQETGCKEFSGHLDELLGSGSDEKGHDGQKEESADGERPIELNEDRMN